MATQIDPKELTLQEQMANIRRMIAESDLRYEEAKRISAEIDQRQVEISRTRQDMFWKPWQVITTVVGGAAALVGVTITLTKLFL